MCFRVLQGRLEVCLRSASDARSHILIRQVSKRLLRHKLISRFCKPCNPLETIREETPMDTLEQEKAEEDGELEITDLPMDEVSSSSVLLVALGSHFSPRSRAWLLTTAGGAIFFVLLVLLTNFPFRHGKALGGVTAATAAKRSPVVLTMATLKADYHPAPLPGISSLNGVPPYCVPGSVPQDFAPDYFGPGV